LLFVINEIGISALYLIWFIISYIDKRRTIEIQRANDAFLRTGPYLSKSTFLCSTFRVNSSRNIPDTKMRFSKSPMKIIGTSKKNIHPFLKTVRIIVKWRTE
jgi:hypothetical protein